MTDPFVLLRIPHASGWRVFTDPVEVVAARTRDEVVPCFSKVQRAVEQGNWAAGFVTYEAASAFALAVHDLPDGRTLPLVWFGIFPASGVAVVERVSPASAYRTGPWNPSVAEAEYLAAVALIKQHIAAGDTYQINYTFRLTTEFTGDPLALFVDLQEAQRGAWAGYVDIGRHAICSASPELFVLREGSRLECRPMKGTSARGLWPEDDLRRARALQASHKNQAENVMVVDMTRNDLGRIATTGSVTVPRLFEAERYPGQWQLTSTVVADAPGSSLTTIFEALFPSGSVTGAPKRRSMEIIRQLESAPRGIYTGAIGCVSPDGNMHFNVAIRSVTVDRVRSEAEFGVGSGIVWDSAAADEFAECLNKAAMLTRRVTPFDLLETFRWRDGAGVRLDRHLARLRESAEYFGFAYPGEDRLRDALRAAAGSGECAEEAKVRVLLSRDGGVEVQFHAIPDLPARLRIAIAREHVSSSDVLLYHKTTRREVYEKARRARPQADAVLLWNERGQITEATEANVVVGIDGRRVTPALACGLLPGVLREELLASGEIEEGVVRVDDLSRASQIWLINSLRGWMPATLSEP